MGRQLIQDPNIIKEFREKYCKNKKSQQINYISTLRAYFKTIKIDNPDEYLTSGRDFNKDVLTFAESMTDMPPKSFSVKMSAVKKFMIRNEVPIKPLTWIEAKDFKKGSRAVTIDRSPSQQELRNILQFADLKMKALALVLSSSGMRTGEALQLTDQDIDLTSQPAKIKIRGSYTKSGDARMTYISDEAASAVKAWMDERKHYLDVAATRINFKFPTKKEKNDNRIFPFSRNLVTLLWARYLKKAKLDKRDPVTGIHELHVHTLRKYFLSNMKLHIPFVIAEALAGHSAYLDDAYRRYGEKVMAEYYSQGVKALSVYEIPADLTKVNKEIEALRSENEEMRKDMEKMMRKLLIYNDKD